ncbi:probable ubiquitin-like-specific protease 2B isoform X2 [Diospyros lotus]|uniref:probable ubiquitin-like-specific protease 2B isoform X2 n=1 Tax=Diospyros lotus TaxID=55363 RepID=UPI002257B407|nr:probable ubiquitin-like-specific protease 2B isoform X2 [Diospyros lotus]
MKNSCKSFEVFDFKEEDELAELASAKLAGKFRTPAAIDRYNFVENDKLRSGGFSVQLEPRALSPGAASPGNTQSNCALQESSSSDESVGVVSDADESTSEGSSPSRSSDIPGDDVLLNGHGPSSDHYFGSQKMGDRGMVVVCPDYIVYRGQYYTEPMLMFSSDCIEFMGSLSYREKGSVNFNLQWGIDDIVAIESQWSERLEIATVKLQLISKDATQAENSQGTSVIEELQFAAVNLNWCKKQEEIMSLDLRYNALVVFRTETGGVGGSLHGQDRLCIPKKRYFPNFGEPFAEVIYPKGDCDAVSISKSDVDLLLPDTFVNDTIIDFYIKYLTNELRLEERQRFHFFNSFFFRKLIDLDKDPSSAFNSGAAFLRVRKWTRKVNLFEKDYIFIPVNFNFHWSLIVICHPGEVTNFQDEDDKKSLKVPCILHMDSIKGTHTGLKRPVQSYLWEEWKEKHKGTSEDIASKFFNLRFIPLELPQQQNSFDCGLFLLHYVERFLEEAPFNFNPFKITKFCNFLSAEWFPPAEPSFKRVHIQRLICKILASENSQPSSSGKPCASNYPSDNENETCVEVVAQTSHPLESCHGKVSGSQACQRIEMTLLSGSSNGVADSGLVFREFLDGQYQTFDRAPSFSEFKGDILSMQEDVEAGEQFVYSPSNRGDFQQLAGIAPGGCIFPYLPRDFGAETSWNPDIDQTRLEDVEAPPGKSFCSSDNSLEVEVKENTIDGKDVNTEEKINQPGSPPLENIGCPKETLASGPREMVDVADSQSPDHTLDSGPNADSLTPSPKSLAEMSHQDCNVQENESIPSADLCLIADTLASEPDEQQVYDRVGDFSLPESDRDQVLEMAAVDSVLESDGHLAAKRVADDSVTESDKQLPTAKKLRLTPPLEEERRLTRSVSQM